MIDSLEWVDDVLSGGCHALIKGTDERYWITPHRASFHEWTWEIFVGAALHRSGFLAWAETLDGPRQSPSTTTPPRHRGKQFSGQSAKWIALMFVCSKLSTIAAEAA